MLSLLISGDLRWVLFGFLASKQCPLIVRGALAILN